MFITDVYGEESVLQSLSNLLRGIQDRLLNYLEARFLPLREKIGRVHIRTDLTMQTWNKICWWKSYDKDLKVNNLFCKIFISPNWEP